MYYIHLFIHFHAQKQYSLFSRENLSKCSKFIKCIVSPPTQKETFNFGGRIWTFIPVNKENEF